MSKKIDIDRIENKALWKLMNDKGLFTALDLAIEIYNMIDWSYPGDRNAPTTSKDYSDYYKNRNALQKRIITNLYDPSSMTYEMISVYCKFFHCSADYLLGFIDMPTHAHTDISSYTGLSDNAINALHLMKTGADNALWYNTELETLNFILENIRRVQKLNKGVGFTDSILNYIGLYLHNDTICKESATNVRYKHDNTKWDSLNNGDVVNGNAVQAVEILADNTNRNINNPDIIPVYDSANNNHYTLDFNKLIESHALNKVTEKLIELKNRYENEN